MNGVPDNPEVLLRERAWLCALARQLVQRGEVADESAHDALSAAVTQASPRTAGARGWLAAILKQQLAGRRRAEHRRQLRELAAARPEAVPSVAATVARFELQRDVANAVLALGEPYRTAVLLRFWDGLSPGSIGRQLSVPVETVRTRLKRGLGMLRLRLDREHGGDRWAWVVPLWLAGRATGSVAASFWMGVALMTAMQKLVVGGAALAAAMLLWVSVPWAAADRPLPATAMPEPAAVAAAVESAGTAAVAGGDATKVDRVAVAPAIPGAWLQVTGRLVDDETDAPLAGLPVRLVCWPRGDGSDVEAVSAADGSFVLADARAPGHRTREVLVQSPQFALAHVHVNYAWDRDGEQEVDVGVVRLVRGTVYSGQVVDLQGRGVADARLLLPLLYVGYRGYGPQNMLEQFATVGMGDQGGSFRLALPIGPDINHRNLLFAVTPQGIGWCRFEPSKQRRNVDDLVVRLRPSGALRVLVQDAAGQPVAGVLVRALPRFGPIGIETNSFHEEVSSDEGIGSRFRGRTNTNGALLLSNLPIGEPSLFREPGREQRDYDLWVEPNGYPQQPLHACELQAGIEQRVAIRLLASRKITVTVDVRDDLGAAIGDAMVESCTERDVGGRTDASGRAILFVEAAPKLGLSARHVGHRAAQQWFEPTADATTLQAKLTLARVHPLDGRVVDQFGAPAAGMWLFVDGRSVGTTDADGRFLVDEFPMGPRQIDVATGPAMEGTHWTGEQSPKTVDAEHGSVTIVMQRRPGRVDVRIAIVDAATGEPLEPTDARLFLHIDNPDGYHLQKQTQATRGLVTSNATPAGRWRLDVVTARGHRGSLPFTLTDGQPPTDLRLELRAPGSITGRLQFVDLTPPAAVTLRVRHATLDPTAYVQFHYPGSWHLDAETQTVTENQFGGTGALRLQPLRNPSFRLDAADPTDDLVFSVEGEGITGEATLRVGPGQTRDLVIDVRKKPPPPR